jgi:zinc transport system permease protein
LLFKEFLAISFDETFATILNVPVDWLYMLLVGLIGLTVVMMMRVVGLIMVIALLTIPPAISNMFVNDIKKMMILSVILSMTFTVVGLFGSYLLDLTSGAVIILVSGLAYLITFLVKEILVRRKAKLKGLVSNV